MRARPPVPLYILGLMLFIAFLSVKFTKKEISEENGFTWFPIKEVAILFAGIFACMIPARAATDSAKAVNGDIYLFTS